jgi:hypothetical protein
VSVVVRRLLSPVVLVPIALLAACGDVPDTPPPGEPSAAADTGASNAGSAAPAPRLYGNRVPSADTRPTDDGDGAPGAAVSTPTSSRVESIDLLEHFEQTRMRAVGVTVDPDSGERFLLDADLGLLYFDDDGYELQASIEQLLGDTGIVLESAFTDVAACGQGRFLMTARNDGFRYDSWSGSFQQHFCYLPDIVQATYNGAGQMTGAVGCDDTRIFAQPQTFDVAGDLLFAQVGTWDLESGEELQWFDLTEDTFLAGGLVPWGDDALLFVEDGALHEFDLVSGALTFRFSLADLGIFQSDGLAHDRMRGQLLILDGGSSRLYLVPESMF